VLLYIGGETHFCIGCQIFTGGKLEMGDLPHVYYDIKCSLISKFERGTDTKNMLFLLISFIKEHYPYVKRLTLQDMSYRECDDRRTIDLSSFYYLMHGETWYMKTVGATFLNVKDRIAFEEASARFNSLKQTMSWEEYDRHVQWKHPYDNDKMKEIYNSYSTWNTYYMGLRDMVGVSELCIYMHMWVSTFVSRVMKFKLKSPTYVIMLYNPKIIDVKYTVEPYSAIKGGRRQTRRRYRTKKPIALF
jgi:hypothetical protein